MSTPAQDHLHTLPPSTVTQNQGKFRICFNFPGRAVPGHDDHGYGPLATVVESFLDPGTHIAMHPHRNEEIISWVPNGVMRHSDRDGNDLVTAPSNLMVMNAGSGFWHAEETHDSDPPLRMLQIFVRPHSLDLDPGIQHEPLPDAAPNEWRLIFGPKGSEAPCFVRNRARCYDIDLDAGETVDLPTHENWHSYVYVFDGGIEIDGQHLDQIESAVSTNPKAHTVTATEQSTLVAFLVDPDAPVTRQGTIGR